MPEALWVSWSKAGRLQAAAKLGKPVEGILPTTNHLESFNKVLKHHYIRRWQRGGRRLRFDFFFLFLTTRIIPSVFSTREHAARYQQWLKARFPGIQPSNATSPSPNIPPPVAWLNLEETKRNSMGPELAIRNLIHDFKYEDNGSRLLARCFSSKSLPSEPQRHTYHLVAQTDGFASCTCQDFQQRSSEIGACKHLIALFKIFLEAKTRPGSSTIPEFWLPNTFQHALAIRIAQPVTPPANRKPTEATSEDMPPTVIDGQEPSWVVNPANALMDILEAMDEGLMEEGASADADELRAGVDGQDESDLLAVGFRCLSILRVF